MKSMKKLISLLLAMAMTMSMITIPVFAEEEEKIEKVITDNTVLTEPFDVINEEEVDAGLYPYDEKTVLVKLAKNTNTLDGDGIASIEYLFKAKDGYWYTAHLANGTTPKMAIEALRSSSSVLVAEYNFLYETGATTLSDNEGVSDDVKNNGKSKDQWHLDSCGFQKAWKKLKNDKKNPGGDSGVIVAVIDTGVDYDHEDLKNNMWVNSGEVPGDGIDNDKNGYVDDYYGVDIVAKKGNGDDDNGHGTHVAGIIAAGNNNVGVVGLAYNTKIMAIKAGQASGYFLNTDVCKAIDYARENGADVINMSFGGSAPSIAVQDALEEAYTHSVLVAAAGNDGKINEPIPGNEEALPCYPAAYSFVLGVMAVDDYGVESSFTNYDAIGFNSVEYELYAPGNAITSTIPNDKYATWNGTSMAAPIVSAMAAVLRSVYIDPDMYPTKFIYGQLASTSERHAECLDPRLHGTHNLPQIANLYDALYKLPHPEISVSDYATFDTSDVDKNNNGDGTVDSGETIALGFELRNRWGMSEDTIVTIDAKSQADIPNPYVEFSADGKNFGDSASIDYGSVGTYSTQDCGKIIENELWTGWENPFYLKVAKDAPNETILAVNVNITSKNALDDNDKTVYSLSEPVVINLIVKNGVVLPQVIDEDMTLTKDNYYIIRNSTVIEEGATVTVSEGTKIQFWTNDSTDPYADKYMAGLVVKGTLNCIGTEDEPVKIFPADTMGQFRVEIYQSGVGKINYYYTELTNLHNGVRYNEYPGFNIAENCEFKQNFKDIFYYRYLEGGSVETNPSYNGTTLIGEKAVNCVFYKLGGRSGSTTLKVNCDGCVFVDSYISYSENNVYENCLFYGNNNYWDNENIGGTSSMTPFAYFHECNEVVKTIRDEKTGISYLEVKGSYKNTTTRKMNIEAMNRLAEYMGGNLLYIENEEEWCFLKNSGLRGIVGAALNDKGEFEWLNGEKLGNFVEIINPVSNYEALWINGSGFERMSSYDSSVHYIIEIPGNVYIEEINLVKNNLQMDTAGSYQLKPTVYPINAAGEKLRYFSGNEAVATVDENGLVTSVDEGNTIVYVFSEDMQVYTSMNINVLREVKVSGISASEELYIDIGNTKALNAVVEPANNTKKVTYKSSDENIVTVDESGLLKATGEGTATITVTAHNPEGTVEANTVVYSSVPVAEIKAPETIYIDLGNTKKADVQLMPSNAVKQTEYTSSNEDIVSVDDNGMITAVSEGVAEITITALNDKNKVESRITVYSYAAVTEIISQDSIEMNVGTEAVLGLKFVPSHSVKPITYESDDENVAVVDEDGNITAVSEGTATITATVFNDNESLSTSTEVRVVIPVEKLQFDVGMLMCKPGERVKVKPVITPSDATNRKLVWDSSNPEIAFVNEDGELVGVAPGLATIKATAENTDVSVYIKAYIGEDAGEMADIVNLRYFDNSAYELYYIITEDGKLRKWGTDNSGKYAVPTVVDITFNGEKIEVADVVYADRAGTSVHVACVLDKNGDLYQTGLWNSLVLGDKLEEKIASGVAKVVANENAWSMTESFIGIMNNGSILVFGTNQNGHLGIGNDISMVSTPVYVALESGEKVIDGYIRGYTSYLLTDDGNVYAAGSGYSDYFTKISENQENLDWFKSGKITVSDGKAYYGNNVLALNNVKRSFFPESSGRYFYVTENNELYFTDGVFENMQRPEFVVMISAPVIDKLVLRENDTNLSEVVYDDNGNITSAYLTEEKLTVGFNSNLVMQNNNYLITLNSGSIQYGIIKTVDLNNFTISVPGGFEMGREYTLTIPAGVLLNESSVANKLITVNFIYEPTMGIVTPREMHIDVGNTKAIEAEYETSVLVTDVNYESSDENIVTVDEEGNVSPVTQGTATVTARFLKGEETVEKQITVYCYYPVTDIISSEEIRLEIGANASMNVSVVPADSLKTIEYKSSDESVATVDENGNITAVSEGSATVTAKVKNDSGEISTETVVRCVIPIESLSFDSEYIISKLSEEYYLIPTVSPSNASIKTCKWETSNDAICYVDENGKLVKNGVGTAVLKAISDYNEKIYAEIVIIVTDDNHENKDVVSVRTNDFYGSYALLEDGTIWNWSVEGYDWKSQKSNIRWWQPRKLKVEFDGKIDDFCFANNMWYIVSDGTLYRCNYNGYLQVSEEVSYYNRENEYTLCNNISQIYDTPNHIYFLLENGDVLYENNSGKTLDILEDISGVSDIYIDYKDGYPDEVTTYFLCYDLGNNSVYVTGYYNGMYYDEPIKIFGNISHFDGKYAKVCYDNYRLFVLGDTSHNEYTGYSSNDTLLPLDGGDYVSYYIDEETGKLHFNTFWSDGSYYTQYQSGNIIENVDKVYECGRNYTSYISYYKTKDNQLFAWDWSSYNEPHPLVFGLISKEEMYWDENSFNLTNVVMDEGGNVVSSALSDDKLIIDFNTPIYEYSYSALRDSSNNYLYSKYSVSIDGNKLIISMKELTSGEQYSLEIYGITDFRGESIDIKINFTYLPEKAETEMMPVQQYSLNSALTGIVEATGEDEGHIHIFTTETVMPSTEAEGKITNTCDCGFITEMVLPKKLMRDGFTAEDYMRLYDEYIGKGYVTNVSRSAIINRLNDEDVTKWLRITAPTGTNKYGFGGNWWGTTNSELINHQIIDYNDYVTLGDIVEGEYLTNAPENTFPFVTEAYLKDESGEVQSIVSGGKVQFVVKFNRDMDAEYGAKVFFGSSYPYADYEIEGEFTDARTWVGETELKTVIENGYQFIRVTNGRTAADENGAHLKLYDDWARFGFEIDTTSAMAMMMQGYADNDGIHLEWMQDDYDTLAGYSVYRADSEDGNYVRLNKTLIPAEENTFTDTDVEPGKKYYYTFKVVLTDATESKPAGKISVTAKDTMAPDVYHSPVYTATTGNKVIISATVSDNIGIENAKLYYRVKGTNEWKTAEMSKSNSKYTASIPAAFVTTEGVEYYIAAFDGVNYTYAGSHTSENPYEITVYQAVENNAKGDVDGDGNITVLDALKLLRAIYDESLLTQEEFLRADINGDGSLSAVEALRILQYANKTISSVLW